LTPLPGTADAVSEADRRRRVVEQLTRIGQTFETYRAEKGSYPDRSTSQGGFSWRLTLAQKWGVVRVRVDVTRSWAHPFNQAILSHVPEGLRPPDRTDGKTNLVAVCGPKTAYARRQGLTAEQCPDGLANTILVVEVDDAYAVPWLAAEDYEFQRETVRAAFFGKRKDCCYALFGGGTGVRRIPANISDDHLLALITPAGGEAIDIHDVTQNPITTVDRELIEELKANPIASGAARPAAAEKPTEPAVAQAEEIVPVVGPPGKPAAKAPADAGDAGAAVPAPTSLAAGGESDNRLPVPTDDALERAAATFRAMYADDIKAAKSREERRALAKKMFTQTGSAAADPAGMFALLRGVRDVAAQGGDVDLAFHAILEMAAMFRVAPLPMQVKVLEQAAPVAKEGADRHAIFDHALRTGDQALVKDAYSEAQRLFLLAQSIARRDDRPADLDRVYRRMEELQHVRSAYQRMSKHATTLVRSPDDPVANAVVGRFLCLVKGDWERGLPRLASGEQAPLRRLALLELRSPNTFEQQLEVGDGWWDWAEAATVPLEKRNARQHAVHWYRLALPNMSSTLEKARLQKRVEEASASQAPEKAPATGRTRRTAG
jgi:hypothetical protein